MANLPHKIGKNGAAPRIRADGRVVLQGLLQVREGHEEGACLLIMSKKERYTIWAKHSTKRYCAGTYPSRLSARHAPPSRTWSEEETKDRQAMITKPRLSYLQMGATSTRAVDPLGQQGMGHGAAPGHTVSATPTYMSLWPCR